MEEVRKIKKERKIDGVYLVVGYTDVHEEEEDTVVYIVVPMCKGSGDSSVSHVKSAFRDIALCGNLY
jgi:hypothetical protein